MIFVCVSGAEERRPKQVANVAKLTHGATFSPLFVTSNENPQDRHPLHPIPNSFPLFRASLVPLPNCCVLAPSIPAQPTATSSCRTPTVVHENRLRLTSLYSLALSGRLETFHLWPSEMWGDFF